jgi:hypothetical protein
MASVCPSSCNRSASDVVLFSASVENPFANEGLRSDGRLRLCGRFRFSASVTISLLGKSLGFAAGLRFSGRFAFGAGATIGSLRRCESPKGLDYPGVFGCTKWS